MGWRLLVSATGVWSTHGFRWALDNGAWTAHNQGLPFNTEKFLGVLEWSRQQETVPDWIVVPDILGSLESIEFSRSWFPLVLKYTSLPLIAVQDGMVPADIDEFVSQGAGVFLGGTTKYKLGTMRSWGDYCKERKVYYHVGRVNTQRRIWACVAAGADSFDGTSVAKFPCTLGRLDRALRQGVLF
jgi:hypothetical protein